MKIISNTLGIMLQRKFEENQLICYYFEIHLIPTEDEILNFMDLRIL
jgi:hypothetical protein